MGQTTWLRGGAHLPKKEMPFSEEWKHYWADDVCYVMLTGFFDAKDAKVDILLVLQTEDDICYFFFLFAQHLFLFSVMTTPVSTGELPFLSAHVLGWNPTPAMSVTHGSDWSVSVVYSLWSPSYFL